MVVVVTMVMVTILAMVMNVTQEVTLMKQTGLLCFADEPQNPFVTSVLASFEQVMLIMIIRI